MIEIFLACVILVLVLVLLALLRTQRAELASLRRLVREEARVLAASVATSTREQRAELASLVQILTPAAPPQLPPERRRLAQRFGDTLPSVSSPAPISAPSTYRMVNRHVFERPVCEEHRLPEAELAGPETEPSAPDESQPQRRRAGVFPPFRGAL